MKKYFLLFGIAVLNLGNSFGQSGMWTWMKGTDSIHSIGHFGTQGIPDPLNTPPSLYEPAEWKETQGYFWTFGGFTNLPSGYNGDYNTLWKFDPLMNEWTWVKGDSLVLNLGNYGIKGVPSIANNPAYRAWGTPTWVDNNDNLWIYGGSIGWDDLWKYNITTNEWTWMQGDTTQIPGSQTPANYGVFRTPDPSNTPGTRAELNTTWTDNDGNLWLFGGLSFDSLYNYVVSSDLWKFDISINEWIWMNGPNISDDHYGNFGTLGVASLSNNPPARSSYSKWKDPDGNFYLFGGADWTWPSSHFARNDVWKYDLRSQMWTWLGGDPGFPLIGYYSPECVTDSMNIPMPLFEDRATVYDSCGNIFHFGGMPASGITNLPSVNELWHYSSCLNRWTLIKADGPISFGSKGIPDPANMPPKKFGSNAWLHGRELWVFAGSESGNPSSYNDLWKFDLDSLCYPDACHCLPTAELLRSVINLCPGTCSDFTNLSNYAITYQWFFPGAIPPTSTDINPTNICYANPGNYDVQLIASNANGSDTLVLTNYITVYPTPPPQSIIQSGDTLFAIAGATSYQWYFNANAISGATDYFYIAPASGDYNVVATDGNGCEVEAVIFNVIAGTQSLAIGQWSLYPNPAGDQVTIHKAQGTSEAAVEISFFNMIGEQMLTQVARGNNQEPGTRTTEMTIDVSGLTPGMYWIEITSGEKTFRAKFIKE